MAAARTLALLACMLAATAASASKVMHNDLHASTVPMSDCQQSSDTKATLHPAMYQMDGHHHDNSDLAVGVDGMFPHVLVAIEVGKDSPFLELTLKGLSNLTYPEDRMHFTVNMLPSSTRAYKTNLKIVEKWASSIKAKFGDLNVKETSSAWEARQNTLSMAMAANADHVFFVDGLSRFTNADSLKSLVALKKHSVTPMMLRTGKWFSNFWGKAQDNCIQADELCSNVLYKRSESYLDIVESKLVGAFEVPMAFSPFLLSKDLFKPLMKFMHQYGSEAPQLDAWEMDVVLSRWLVRQAIPPFVANLMVYGHLINPTGYDASHMHPDMYLIDTNPIEWEELYLHPAYNSFANMSSEACTDVFKVPFLSGRFTSELIEECENFGDWSSGSYKDERLQGGYEPVPTQDIHLNQLGLSDMWHFFLRQYVRPVTTFHYPGYTLEGRYTLDFVVRYHPDFQASLRPHHDASTVTVNIALNQGGVDYQGGGTHFHRQKCTVKDAEPGWGTLSPGRLTHLHEGLETTAGTRYILVSFIDQV